MGNTAWKQRERQISTFFNTTRKIGSGGYDPNDSSDTNHPALYIEAKLRAASSIHSLWKDTAGKAKKEGKIPVVCTAMKNHPGFLITVHSDDFDRFLDTL